MEKKHTRRISERYRSELQGKDVVCLYISDDYEYMDEQLIEILRDKVAGHIGGCP